MDVWDKIASGYYRPNREYPKKPIKPEVLNKTADQLSREEIEQLLEYIKDYEGLSELAGYL